MFCIDCGINEDKEGDHGILECIASYGYNKDEDYGNSWAVFEVCSEHHVAPVGCVEETERASQILNEGVDWHFLKDLHEVIFRLHKVIANQGSHPQEANTQKNIAWEVYIEMDERFYEDLDFLGEFYLGNVSKQQ